MASLLLAIIYLSFISLGLPDALLGSAWPIMYREFGVPLSYAGIIAMIISAWTVISSLLSDRLTKKFGTGVVMTVSVAMTAVALFGFSVSTEFYELCLWTLPYGFGAGSVDASINNYVAVHYESRHMSWLHSMWGVGISIGPYIMSYALTNGMEWGSGYRVVFLLQAVLTVILIFSLPLWKKRMGGTAENGGVKGKSKEKPLSIKEVLSITGAKEIMIAFFCYSVVEQTSILWGTTYLTLYHGLAAEKAASFASLFCIGITIGRAISGFLTIKFSDTSMIRMGTAVIATGIVFMFLPIGITGAFIGLALIGFGCAPVYPCIIHSTPVYFGADKSQAVIGIQMASAYIGTTAMPPLFGVIANHISVGLLPVYVGIALLIMFSAHEKLVRLTAEKAGV